MRSDVVVNVRGGTYNLSEPLRMTDEAGDSGTNGHQVVYQAYGYGTGGQEKVTLSGGRAITGWTRADDGRNVWRASVGDLETRQLYVDGRRAARTATSAPLSGLTFKVTDTGYVVDSDVPLSWSRPEDMEIVYKGAVAWAEPRCGIASISGDANSTTIVMDQPCFRRAQRVFAIAAEWGNPQPLKPTLLENSKSFLSDPGSFYLDRSKPGEHTLYYVPRPGEDLRRASVVAPVLETLVSGSGSAEAPLHDVTIRGFDFAYATWNQPSGDNGFINWFGSFFEDGDPADPKAQLSEHYRAIPGHVAFLNTKRIIVEGNRFGRLGGQALEIGASDKVMVRGNVISDVSGGGILVGDGRPKDELTGGSRDNVVENNWIHDIGREFHASVGIYAVETTDLTIRHNQINDLPYTGLINIGASQSANPAARGTKILDNRVFDLMKVLHDGGGIYLNSAQGSSYSDGAVVSGNVVHGLKNGFNTALYTDLGSRWVTVRGNVAYDALKSAGGCSLEGDSQVRHIRFAQNFWVHPEPFWGCGKPAEVEVGENTVLPADAASEACLADRECRAIVRNAGLEPRYRRLLDSQDQP
ncbi:right-handed parallel beta-helix repeat-containing protein [Actinomadura mexicana]|nr:right-handed parallel beta-helix repeat-containing protein [Actinomadura mexicana]